MSENLIVPTMAEMLAQGKQPEVLFWVGCAGSFDDRAKKITKALVRILNRANVSFAVLGTEESCTGDPAKRAGNEFLFQMQAMMNIEVLNAYEAKKIVNQDLSFRKLFEAGICEIAEYHRKPLTEWEQEQERNLDYVARTRARKNLFYIEDYCSDQERNKDLQNCLDNMFPKN